MGISSATKSLVRSRIILATSTLCSSAGLTFINPLNSDAFIEGYSSRTNYQKFPSKVSKESLWLLRIIMLGTEERLSLSTA